MSASAAPRIHSWFDFAPQAAAAISALVGALVLAGWVFGVETLKSVVPGLTSMKVNTAVSFILAGVALFVVARDGTGRPLRVAAQACSALMLAVGLLTLAEYVSGADLGIDVLPLRWMTRPSAEIAGRMAVNTAISVAALGAALLLLASGRGRMVAVIHLLAVLPLILGGSALIGYGYDIEDFLRVNLNYTPVSMPAAVVFVLLAFGVMNARADYPFRRFATGANAAGVMVRRLLPAAIVFTVLIGELIDRGRDLGYFSGVAALALFAATVVAGLTAMILGIAGTLYDAAVQRDRMEDELRAASHYARSLIEASLDPLVTVSPAGKITDVNEATVMATGVARETLLGSDFSDYFTEPDKARAGYREAFEKGFVTDYPLTLRHVSGSEMEVLYNASVYRNGSGAIAGVFAAARDVTARKRAEDAARLQAVQYATLLATTTDGYWRCTADGLLLEVNDAYCRMSGYTREELLGMSIPQIEALESPEEVARHARLVREKGFDRFETRHRRKNGEIWGVEVSTSLAQSGELLVFARDITERRRNEALNASRLHLVQYAQTHTLDELLEETLNETERLTGSLIGFYHFVEEDQNSLTLQTWSTRTKAEFCRADGTGLHYALNEAGVWADCAREGRPVIHNDYASLPNRKGMPEGHARVVRELVVPVRRGDRISAILGVGNKATDYTQRDVEVVLMVADLTGEIAARKRAEEALLEREERLRLIAETIQDVFWISTPGVAKILYISPAYERMWERSCDSLYRDPKSFLDPVHPDDLPILQRMLAQHAGGEAYEIEYRVVWRSGAVRWMRERGFPVRNEDGSLRAMAGVTSDVTERKQLEAALRQAAAYTRSLIEASLDPLATISADGKITDVNEAATSATGIPREQLLGSDFSDYFTEPDKARAVYREVFAKGVVTGYLLTLRHASGSEMEVLYNASVYRDGKGMVAGVVAAARDVTGLRRAERQAQERVKELRAFYHLSELAARRDFSLDSLCEALVKVLPASWQYPDIACARIVMGEREFRTPNFAVSEWMLAAPVRVVGAVAGKVEVGYLEQRPQEADGPFFLEERQLIDAIAERIGQIAELKRAEEALRASEELFRALADATSEGMLIHEQGRIVEINRQMEDVLRRRRAEVVGAPVIEFVAPAWRELVARRIQAPESSRAEFAFQRPDGSEVYVSGLSHPAVYQGRPMRVAAYRDITLERRAEEALRTAGQYNRTLIEVSLDPLVTINPEGKIADVNEATVAATGVPRTVLIGSDFSDYFTEPEKARAGYQEVFAKGFIKDYPLSLRHVSGRVTEVLYNASIYRNARGEVAGVFATARDVTERKKLEQELERQAHIDLLTDLSNRRHFVETAEQEMARARRHDEPLCLLMLDLDHFKRVNDTHGHQAGDMVLQNLGDVCRRTFRAIDIVGRLGGEEFAALLPETGPEQALEVAERLREAVARTSVTLEDGTSLSTTASIGVTRVEVSDTRISVVLKRADAALYKAKSGGRNRVCMELLA